MNLWTAAELDAIAANPKRKHVRMLIEEVRRLTAIAVTANQLIDPERPGEDRILLGALRERLAEPRTAVED